MDRVVVALDLGEVLASPRDLMNDLARRSGAPHAEIEAAYWRHRPPYDEGNTSRVYWAHVLEDAGCEPDDELINDLERIDTHAWMTLRADAIDLLQDLQAVGATVSIVSNMPAPLSAAARSTSWARYVDNWFFSGEMGTSKPSPEIYARAAAELGVDAGSILFVDDRPVNVDAARAAGWRAYLWTSGVATRALMVELGII